MVGSRQRRGGRPESVGGVRIALGLVSGALAIALCAVLVDRFVLGAEWWQVRHTVTAEPVTPQSEAGPPPGPLTVSWDRTTRAHHGSVAGYDGVAHAVGQGQVVTASGSGLEVWDARTGASRWSYRRAGWTLLGWASTRTRIVGYFERDGDRGARLFVAFDALSGGLLWRREGERPAAVSRATLRWPAGSDVLLTTDDARRTLYGVSAVTGNRVWRLPLPRGCRLSEGGARPSDGRETLAALALDCAGNDRRSRLLAVDPAKGTARWNRPLGSRESPEVAMLDGVTLVSDGTALRAFDDAGEPVADWDGDGVCGEAMCPAVLTSGRLVIVYHPKGTRGRVTRMEARRVPSGEVEWRRDVPEYAALAEAGGRVFALRPRLSERLLPAGVDIVDPGDGSTTTAPAPFSVNPDLPSGRPWLAAAGGLLYAGVPQAAPRPEGAVRLFALRGGLTGTGPAELGGVPEGDWPDACSVLKEIDLAAARVVEHTAEPVRASAGSVRLPRPVACAYRPPKEDGKAKSRKRKRSEPVESGSATPSPMSPSPTPGRTGAGGRDVAVGTVSVSVRWVARTGEIASRMLEALQAAQAQARPRRDIGADEAYEIGPAAGTIALRVGRYVVVVEADRPAGAAARLARSVAFRLHHSP
ncbi:outer membrane protein assembly factor BamB [Actinomadura pelletieri DSM 43383]|uniref:Outer membrane protein assembly factor BamB n=1 Tax=Actinomadura pelletieri DSM 43383 TaxID=1120940 RepID=A0A495QSC5_9ACTN|nr:PQQ-binding-like beta-propeller repeat protein [Actinomadura pelletieri]RKS76343.1 outer membrane protein assembly factor BamB [Actinomadura pelletieri DSM 43383]